MSKEKLIADFRILMSKGKMSKPLKDSIKQMITYLNKNDINKIGEIAWLHQDIGGSTQYKYWEDQDYNHNLVGKSVYELYDLISHGRNSYIYSYKN